MKSILATCLIAGGLAMAAVVPPVAADTPPTNTTPAGATVKTTSAALEQVTKSSVGALIDKARTDGKPVLLVAVSPKCTSCAALVTSLQEAAAKHPELIIVTADADSFGVAVAKMPLAGLVAPTMGRHLVYQKFNFNPSPAELEAFIAEHGSRAVTMTRLDNEVRELSASLSPLLEKLQELMGRNLDNERQDRIALDDKIAGILDHMAKNQHRIAETLKQERDASDK